MKIVDLTSTFVEKVVPIVPSTFGASELTSQPNAS
jgi:hypothetical protein